MYMCIYIYIYINLICMYAYTYTYIPIGLRFSGLMACPSRPVVPPTSWGPLAAKAGLGFEVRAWGFEV